MTARIVQLSRSQGGVPKYAVTEAYVGELGLDGDRQAHPKIHGGPECALCLCSLAFVDGKFKRLGRDGEMRWYARVIRGGLLRVEQTVRVAFVAENRAAR